MAKKRTRQGTKKKGKKPTDTHSFISCGDKDSKVLRYMFNNKDSRFSVRGYSVKFNIARSSVYEVLNRLKNKGFIDKKYTGMWYVTSKGKSFLNVSEGGVGTVRKECRVVGALSTHFQKFKLNITDRTKFRASLINKLNPVRYKKVHLKNLMQYFIYFEDSTIIIKPKCVIIRIHDIISDDMDSIEFDSLNRVMEHSEALCKLGVVTDSVILEDAHYARIKSHLSDFLSKIDDRYYLELPGKRKFWIDHSNDKKEDETNDKDLRERLDTFLDDALSSDALVSEIPKMKEVVGMIVKLRAVELKLEVERSKRFDVDKDDSLTNYFG